MRHTTIALAAVALLSAGPAFAQTPAPEQSATASMIDRDGAEIGTVTFHQTQSGVLHVIVEVAGLEPGARGFHIHENGTCDPEDGFESAGGHYSGDRSHGIHAEDGPHPGDFPNVHVGQDGVLKVEFFSHMLSLSDDAEYPLIGPEGSAVIIHEGADDYTTDPSGEAGDRIACGVIEQPV